MANKQLFTFFIFCLTSFGLLADNLPDTTIYLNEVSINSNIVHNFSSGNKIQKLTPKTIREYQSNSLVEILSSQAMVNIKSYGISGISNISMRGSQTNQTAVLWNGINLQDPLNGSVNPSLLPLGLVDEITIQYGGSGALYGSGAVGGVIMLKKKLDFNTGWNGELLGSLGSFSNYKGQIKIQYGGQKYAGSLIFYQQLAANDFPYTNIQAFGNPKIKQENASTNSQGLAQDNSYIISDDQKINTHLWYQKCHRQIASNMTVSGAQQFQNDQTLRFSGDWIKYGEKLTLMSRLAFLHSLLDYQDPNAQLKAIHLSSSIIGQFEMNWQINEYQLINWGVNHRYDMASSDNFPINTNRNTTAFFLSYRLQLLHKTVHMTSSIREELIDDQFGEPTPSIGMDWLPLQNLKILAKISRNYRTPTFNDLFWQGGYAHGNTDLMAESGWNEELGMEFKKVISIYEASLQLNIFNSHINNLIVWLPENNIWSPVNKKKVWSRGLEIGLQNQFHISQITSMGMNLFFNYNPSELYQGENKGKQLIYSPIMHTKLKYYFNRKIWGFALIYQWYDQRFTTEDNSMYLNPYQLFNLDIHLIIPIKKQALSMYFKVNNIFNELYQSVENYATPLRNFQISIHYQF